VSDIQTTAIGSPTGSTAREWPRFSYSQRAVKEMGLALNFSQGVKGDAGNRGLEMRAADIFMRMASVNYGSRALQRNNEK